MRQKPKSGARRKASAPARVLTKSHRLKRSATDGFSNIELVTLAVGLLGGALKYVDTEDAAIKAAELAPGRFGWKKYPDQVNLEIVRVYLSDAKKPSNGAYVLGSGNTGWMLSEKGSHYVQRAKRLLSNNPAARKALSQQEKVWRRSERRRLLTTDAFSKWSDSRLVDITPDEAAAFFRIDPYVTGQARETKIVRISNAFAEDRELGEAVKVLAEIVRRNTKQ